VEVGVDTKYWQVNLKGRRSRSGDLGIDGFERIRVSRVIQLSDVMDQRRARVHGRDSSISIKITMNFLICNFPRRILHHKNI
jgi:hypothetical protein